MKKQEKRGGYVESLQVAIRRLHGCESVHVRSEPVTETHQGKTVWDGVVEVFDLQGHPKAKRCYAWSHASGKGDKGARFVAVLELPPVDSARAAVRAAIVQEYRDERMRKGMIHAAGMTYGLLKSKPLPFEGGWRVAREVDGEFEGWLCSHVHATEQEAEACKKWDEYL